MDTGSASHMWAPAPGAAQVLRGTQGTKLKSPFLLHKEKPSSIVLDANQSIAPCPRPGTPQEHRATEPCCCCSPGAKAMGRTNTGCTNHYISSPKRRVTGTHCLGTSRTGESRQGESTGAPDPAEPKSLHPAHPWLGRSPSSSEGCRARGGLQCQLLLLTPCPQRLCRLLRAVRVWLVHAEVTPVREALQAAWPLRASQAGTAGKRGRDVGMTQG